MENVKKVLFVAIGLLLLLTVTACSEGTPNEISVQNIKEMVHEYSVGSFGDVSASITSDELIVTSNNGRKIVYDLPKDEFFVSIAPFVKTTHPCAIHSLTGCQGELVDKDFEVYIQDQEGNVLVDDTIASFANGFIDFWLPRNKTYHVKLQYDGKTAESEISTYKDDNTCITTMRLL